MARERSGQVSGLTRSLPARDTASERIQDFPTDTSRALLSRLAGSAEEIDALFAGLCGKHVRLDQTDGLRICFGNGELIHYRPSGNAPELRCYAESDSPLRARDLVSEGLRRISSLADDVTAR